MTGTESASYSVHFGIELYEGKLRTHHFPLHYHAHYTLILVEEGEMVYQFADEPIRVQQGEAFLINPLDAHRNRPGANGCVYQAIFLPLSTYAARYDTPPRFARQRLQAAEQVSVLQAYWLRIRQLGSEAEKQQLLTGLGGWLLSQLSPVPPENTGPCRILPALQFIDRHLDEKLVVGQLAGLCFMSPFHFQRVFKKSTGLTPKAFIQQQRTELAKQRLQEGQPACETVYETGYFDQGHFHRAFRKMWVVNPSYFSRKRRILQR